jgi:hypothetical protein
LTLVFADEEGGQEALDRIPWGLGAWGGCGRLRLAVSSLQQQVWKSLAVHLL